MDSLIHEFISINLWNIVSSKGGKDEKLQKIVEEISEFLRIERCSLMLKDDSGNFRIVAAYGLPRKVVEQTVINPNEDLGNIAGMAIRDESAILIRKIGLTRDKHSGRYKTDNFISYPIIDKGEIIGVLNVTDRKDETHLSEKDLESISHIVERVKFVVKEA